MRRLNKPQGRPWDVRIQLEDPPWLRPQRRPSGAKGRGLVYEERALCYLARRYEYCLPKPWLAYVDNRQWVQWCQPDALIIDPWLGTIVVIEIKYQHVPEAGEQLFDIYQPVLESAFPSFDIHCVEVCRWFDPATLCQWPLRLSEFPDRPHPGVLNVHLWRP